MKTQSSVYVNNNFQQLIESRYELDRLAFDEGKTVQDIAAFFSTHALTWTPQQAPALVLLQRKVEKMNEGLASKLKKILEQLAPSSDPDDLFLMGLTKMVCNPGYPPDKIRQFLTTARTTFQKELKERWNQQAPEEVLKAVLCQRTAQSVSLASSPFFQACFAKGINPFSVMCAKKEVVLNPCNGYSIAHAAALETDSIVLQQLFDKNPAQFEQKTPLGGTVWDLLRARGHGLSAPIVYPFGIPRRYLSQSILMPEICQEFMKLTPVEVDPIHQGAFQQYQERKKRGEADPVEVFQIQEGPLKGQFGVRAKRKIEAGELIVMYRGKITCFKPGQMKDDSYNQNFDHFRPLLIQASAAGSMGEMLNHGPPNCAAVEFQEDGIPCLGLIALRELAQGEELFQNYTIDYFPGREFIELAPKLVDDYLKETGNLSSISPFKMRDLDGKTDVLHLIVSAKEAKFTKTVLKNSESKSALFHHLNYHRAMLNYICHFPHRALERLNEPNGRKLAENWTQMLDALAQGSQLSWLGITQERCDILRKALRKLCS